MLKGKYSIVFIVIAFVLIGIQGKAQRCSDFHKTSACLAKPVEGFKLYGQSRSAFLEINKPFEYKFVLYGNKDFILVLCTEYRYSPIHFRLIDEETKEVIYDNSAENYVESIGFTNENTRKVILEVTLLAERIKPEDGSDTRACAGFNIQWRKIPKIGFN